MVKVLIDNGHGENTPGKCSPDKRLREYAYAREIARRVEKCLRCKGYEAQRIVEEETDVPLSERCKRVNDICKQVGTKNVLLVSIHNNAAGGDGKWHEARGFSAHVGLNASSKSKMLAQYLWNEAIQQGLKGNRSVPAAPYIAQNLAICRDTACPAVLTENLFQDNKEDVELLLSEEGKEKVTATHVNAIVNFIKDYYG
ncbi:N-acetylmuramoyl-L-alanine amidase [Prevotellamassilia timonensis]|jgi:N-acetylmuramoyl-L-alanine amidase|uniref:N-acetylmuramoyl-L-alanine amidase n=1 Tax=Prevotellamassilia timonensis TaxID=1852370 RepID=UPI00204CE160|nr:MAG TPA: Cell wall hydrolase autolysin [Caudoviricetes sp.]